MKFMETINDGWIIFYDIYQLRATRRKCKLRCGRGGGECGGQEGGVRSSLEAVGIMCEAQQCPGMDAGTRRYRAMDGA